MRLRSCEAESRVGRTGDEKWLCPAGAASRDEPTDRGAHVDQVHYFYSLRNAR